METRLHGALPENWRDPTGVFRTMPESATPVAEDPSAQVTRLAAEKSFVDARLTALLDKVRSGETDPRIHAELTSAAEEAAQLSNQLETAKRAAEEAESNKQAQLSRDRRQRLEATLVKAEEHKRLFAETYRSACLALGDYCAAMDEATRLANSLATQLGVAPLDANRIAALKADLDPLRTFAGFKPTAQYGWNLAFQCVPLHTI